MLVLIACILPGTSISYGAIITEGDAFFSGEIYVAQQSGDGSLTIINPTVIDNAGGIFIANQTGLTGTVTVDGGTYRGEGDFILGQFGGHGSLEIVNGGKVYNTGSYQQILGETYGSTGNILVSGNNSQLDTPATTLLVGNEDLGTLEVESGARANHGSAYVGSAQQFAGAGKVYVRDSGSRWDIQSELVLGELGGSGELWVQNGGQLRTNVSGDSIPSIVGGENSSGLAVVEGTGSHWQHTGYPYDSDSGINVGYRNGTGTLIVRDGGKVSTSRLKVGGEMFGSTGGNGTAIIDGLGSQITVGYPGIGDSGLDIGNDGIGQVMISNGGKLTSNPSPNNAVMTMGYQTGSRGRLVVDGITSQWIDHSQVLRLGEYGRGELIIQNGAVVTNQSVFAASNPSSSAHIHIDGEGSQWNIHSFIMGNSGPSTLEVSNGGTLTHSGESAIREYGEIILDNGKISPGAFAEPGNVSNGIGNLGLIQGHGEIQTIVANFENAQIRVEVGQKLRFTGSMRSHDNSRIDIQGGELEVSSEIFFNDTDVVLTMENGTLRSTGVDASLFNRGSIQIASGLNRIYGGIQNHGSIIASGLSQTTFYDDVFNYGTFNVSTGSVATLFGDLHGNGIVGGGTVFLEGDVFPGFSPGEMGFNADVVLGFASSLTMEAFGDQPGTEYDMLSIEGEATLGGELLLNIQAPLGDVTLTLLEADSISGTFDTVPELYSHVGHGMFLTEIIYSENSVSVSLVEGLADFDHDADVDDADLEILFANYGSNSSEADANGDGTVSGSDFLTWARKFGSGSPIPAAATQVPEPSGILIGMLSMICLASQRKAIGR